MHPPDLPFVAYACMGISVFILTYVTFTDDINAIPGMVSQAASNVATTASNSIRSVSAQVPPVSSVSTALSNAGASITKMIPSITGNSSEKKEKPLYGGSKRRQKRPSANKTNKCRPK
jgi:hypothetical protein